LLQASGPREGGSPQPKGPPSQGLADKIKGTQVAILNQVMVVVSEGCSCPRAYAGLASAYREVVTGGFERLDDPTWETQFMGHTEVPWMADLVAP
jgi:hypothetical protein